MTQPDAIVATTAQAKDAARRLRAALPEAGLTHAQALEAVARVLGHRDWNTAAAALATSRSQHVDAVPVLRVTDGERALAFYRDYLGYEVEFEHRFEPGMPLYARVRRGGVELDLSEHHGDGTPGSVAWIAVADVHAYRDELHTREFGGLRPGVEEDSPGGPTMDVTDPFGNGLRFCQLEE